MEHYIQDPIVSMHLRAVRRVLKTAIAELEKHDSRLVGVSAYSL